MSQHRRQPIPFLTLLGVCADIGVEVSVVRSRERNRFASRDRCKAWRRLREDGYSYPQIADATGHDHTTVMHGVKK